MARRAAAAIQVQDDGGGGPSVGPELLSSVLSVFLFCWFSGLLLFASNSLTAKQMESLGPSVQLEVLLVSVTSATALCRPEPSVLF